MPSNRGLSTRARGRRIPGQLPIGGRVSTREAVTSTKPSPRPGIRAPVKSRRSRWSSAMVQISRAATRPVGDEVTVDGANAALPSPPALFPKHDAAVHSAPALSNQHGTATEHAAPKGFRLAINPAASSEIGISQCTAVAAPNQ